MINFRIAIATIALIWISGWAVGGAEPYSTQDDEMDFILRVEELESQLSDLSEPKRMEAEKELIQLGPRALDHLSAIDDSMTSDLRERLTRVRAELEKQAVIEVSQTTKVSLSGNLALDEILKQIEKQTGNRLLAPPGWDAEVPTPATTLEIEQTEFWKTVDQVLEAFNLDIDPFASDEGSLQLVRKRVPGPDDPTSPTQSPSSIVDYSGIMRLAIVRVDAARSFISPSLNNMSFEFQVRWEPRLTPIAIELPMQSIEIVDDLDNDLQPPERVGVIAVMVQPQIPETSFNLRTPLLDRQVKQIKSISGVLKATLPGRVESFVFKDIQKMQDGAWQRKAGATVTYHGVGKNDDLFEVGIELSFDEEYNALESYQAWALDNEVYLNTKDGNQIPYIALETFRQTNESLGVRYFFPEFPEGADLVYRTPAAIVRVELPFKLVKIPLP